MLTWIRRKDARMLGPYAGNDTISKRITMLEGPPFAPELQKLKSKFRTMSFPSVFRDTKLLSGSGGSFPNGTSNGTLSKPPTWAATLAPRPVVPLQSPKIEKAAIADEYGEYDWIPQNSKGQRIDPPIVDPPQKITSVLINNVKDRHYCNNYHIYGDCSHYGCKHEHGEKLGGMNLKTLRMIARSTPCRDGLDCEDLDCYWGHHCGREYCKADQTCRYTARQHNIDTKIVNG